VCDVMRVSGPGEHRGDKSQETDSAVVGHLAGLRVTGRTASSQRWLLQCCCYVDTIQMPWL